MEASGTDVVKGTGFVVVLCLIVTTTFIWSKRTWDNMEKTLSRNELRHLILQDIDNAVKRTWVIPARTRAILTAFRSIVIEDDALLDKINQRMPAYSEWEDDMPKKSGTGEEATNPPVSAEQVKMQARNWADKFLQFIELAKDKGPAIIAALEMFLLLMSGNNPPVQHVPDGCTDPHLLCCDSLEASLRTTAKILNLQCCLECHDH